MTHIAIIGGGIVGAATLEALSRAAPTWTLTLIEKEDHLAGHQSGRNSGVIHSGIYYKPGSLKARYCRLGVTMLEQFCRDHSIDYERRGKLISANLESQQSELTALLARGKANGIECRLLTASEAHALEPRLVSQGAIEVPETGIVDYAVVTNTLAKLAEQAGARLHQGVELKSVHKLGERLSLVTTEGSLQVDGFINCAGLHSGRIARMAGLEQMGMIVPFRGEYYRLKPRAADGLSGRLIYPMPDPRLPFLGVHLTPTIAGDFLLGPNAVLALALEGYRWSQINPTFLARLLTYPGFIRLAAKYWRHGLAEMIRSLSVVRFAKSAGELIRGIRQQDLLPAESGVRAQLVSQAGQLVDDFQIRTSPAGLHLLNAPSPAATSSLAIGAELAQQAIQQFSG